MKIEVISVPPPVEYSLATAPKNQLLRWKQGRDTKCIYMVMNGGAVLYFDPVGSRIGIFNTVAEDRFVLAPPGTEIRLVAEG